MGFWIFVSICAVIWIVVMMLLMSVSQACSRRARNMVFIKEGYCYDKETKIIYIESYTGRYGDDTVYTPYYDTNGDLCKYDVDTKEWISICQENHRIIK